MRSARMLRGSGWRMLALGGIGWFDISVCHRSSPSPRLPSGSPSTMAFETMASSRCSSECCLPSALGGQGSRSPKIRLNLINSGSEMNWPRNKRTRCPDQASSTAWILDGFSGRERSTPRTSAPSALPVGMISITSPFHFKCLGGYPQTLQPVCSIFSEIGQE